MVTKEAKRVIANMAQSRGISESEVREEMQIAILEGYKNRESNRLWMEFFGDDIPSPEEFVIMMTTAVMASRI